jgi:hypothetical protein
MLVLFTEVHSQETVAISPDKVVSVLTVQDDGNPEASKFVGKTAVVLTNGNVLVEESFVHVVGVLNAELK